ncbi:hypothetical protein [Litoreibacter roseus]|uniref:Uncharacterized protein n=1 Tax=Litoreibacter roseus TaxID=2601869 RepID=A0A6N6JJS6_9RHOB|nr:hypothetical protein [Litoreibacter roseus]GFE65432.1 hypothetical protein KIN_25060 [Litoreibacter roseus]
MIRAVIPALLLCLSACAADLPDERETISAEALAADYPRLQPIPPLLAAANQDNDIAETEETLSSRADGLRTRASNLRGRSILDGATRLKLENAALRNNR